MMPPGDLPKLPRDSAHRLFRLMICLWNRISRRPKGTGGATPPAPRASQVGLMRQLVVLGLAAQHHRDDAEDREAAHERGNVVEIAAERPDQQPRDERPEAGDDPPGAVAEGDAGRADMGRKQLGEVYRMAREHAEYKEPENRQDHGVPRLIGRQREVEDQPEGDRPEAVEG